MKTALGEMSNVFEYVFGTFLQNGFKFLDSLSFTINGTRFSMFNLILGTLIFAVVFFIIKFLLGIQFNVSLSDYKAGRPHIVDSVTNIVHKDAYGNVSQTSTASRRVFSNKIYKSKNFSNKKGGS